MTAAVDRPPGSEGVLAAWGTANTGFSWFLQAGEIVFDYNLFGTHHIARAPAPDGETGSPMVSFDRNEGGAVVTVGLEGGEQGTVQVPFVLRMIAMSGFDVGLDAGSQVSTLYDDTFPFTGTYHHLDVEITDDLSVAEILRLDQERIRQELAQQ